MGMQRQLAVLNRRYTNRLLGPMSYRMPPLAVVDHVGRKTGRPYSTPVIAIVSDGRAFVLLNYGPETQWAKNVLSVGEYTLHRGGRALRVTGAHQVASDSPEVPALIRVAGAWPVRPVIVGYVVT
ncbi:nitroreductase family deazaflavin-dependent oxidoreductase [Tsukamurella sp. 8F]|uniref:nitroreductase family deazaflavin-dependent oxidoreductase n=1 Tax=unclassified Tsukamurella TaxID=2633480 RepID=UPI0023B90259|nr:MULTISPECIES: nitroreductase family deazaflavin-dependent oxidoreductase [unclassified Tsukamurella]MDF0532160.1 nitroreductase family deazaflavin-dependent oxidoreductase [Tsukamurella sp. 8J]MDF0589444.1 nitroreductase family deazaflavin-dependent oxidoreductase [Tsukamurella sp. 8F]